MRGKGLKVLVPLLLVSITLGWLRWREAGPRLKGLSVSEWLVQYGQAAAPGRERKEVEAALESLGTRIIPQVIRTLDYVETRRHREFIARKKAIYAWIGIEAAFVDDEPYRLEGAMAALPLLGADAQYALPQLVKLLERPGASVGGARAGKVLASLGSMGHPALIAALDNPDPYVRFRAATNLDPAGNDAPLIVDLLVKTVQSEDIDLATAAASALSRMKVDSKLAVPLLLVLLSRPNQECRVIAMQKLSEYGSAARDAVPAILEVGLSGDFYLSQTALAALQRIAPDVLTNSPGSKLYRRDPRLRFLFPGE